MLQTHVLIAVFIKLVAGIFFMQSLLRSEARTVRIVGKHNLQRRLHKSNDSRRLHDTYWPWQFQNPQWYQVNDTGYHPYLGYEPYWQYAYWYHNASRVPTRDPRCQYNVCPVPFRLWGPVCGRKEQFYKNFTDYCEFLDLQCSDTGNWRIVTRGPCPPPAGFLLYPVKYLQSTAANYVMNWMHKTLTTVATTRYWKRYNTKYDFWDIRAFKSITK